MQGGDPCGRPRLLALLQDGMIDRWRPLRSPSCPRCHMLTLPRDTFIFIRTFNAEKAGSKSVEMHITGIKLQAGIVFVSQLLYL